MERRAIQRLRVSQPLIESNTCPKQRSDIKVVFCLDPLEDRLEFGSEQIAQRGDRVT